MNQLIRHAVAFSFVRWLNTLCCILPKKYTSMLAGQLGLNHADLISVAFLNQDDLSPRGKRFD